jgi:heme/copper-type cytochrome/quinol oxidase subunit 4
MNASKFFHLSVTGVWLLLITVTVFAWWLIDAHHVSASVASVAVLCIAALKVRLVFLHFMELSKAPFHWRIAFEVWVVFFFAIMLLGYLH